MGLQECRTVIEYRNFKTCPGCLGPFFLININMFVTDVYFNTAYDSETLINYQSTYASDRDAILGFPFLKGISSDLNSGRISGMDGCTAFKGL